jgi:hypothetical protein
VVVVLLHGWEGGGSVEEDEEEAGANTDDDDADADADADVDANADANANAEADDDVDTWRVVDCGGSEVMSAKPDRVKDCGDSGGDS